MTEVAHGLFIAVRGKPPLIINLTNVYELTMENSSSLHIVRRQSPFIGNSIKDSGIVGMAVMYGVNGAGKTELLINSANIFGDAKGEKSAGVLYEREGAIYLRKGKALQACSALTGDDVVVCEELPRCRSVFYTTSPFDTERRGRLRKNTLANDVSPVFGEMNTFDGLDLLEAREGLNQKFIERGKIRVELATKNTKNAGLIIADRALGSAHPLHKKIRAVLNGAAQELAPAENRLLGLWLTLLLTVLDNFDLLFPKAVTDRLLGLSDSRDVPQTLAAIQTEIVAFCAGKLGADAAGDVIALLQKLSEKEFAVAFGRQFQPQKLDEFIQQKLPESRPVLRLCADLGLVRFSLSHLSSGETAYAMLFSAVHSGLRQASEHEDGLPVLLLIDEGEMFMHPQWQRKYIEELLRLLQKFPQLSNRIYLLLTTHSLIVAADAPPHTLFNTENGARPNGFGMGPRRILSEVYGVEAFHGEYSESQLARIETFIRTPSESAYPDVKALIVSLGEEPVKDFLHDQVDEAYERLKLMPGSRK